MQGTARLTGQTIGAILMNLLFTLTPAVAAPRIGLAVASIFALAAGLVSLSRGRTTRFSPSAGALSILAIILQWNPKRRSRDAGP
jgi:hypothetical protein